MRIGLFTALYPALSLDEVIGKIKPLGIEALEFGTGNYPGDPHLKLDWLKAPAKIRELRRKLDDEGITISALSCHGNALHPNRAVARAHAETSLKTVLMAERLGVETVIDFSGCPGDSDRARYPNWSPTPWPPDFAELLQWQWEKKAIPYWKKHAQFARDHGVRIAVEMHPGCLVYNPETLLRLRAEIGATVGCNFDPSHLVWQGIDPSSAVRALGAAIFHVHAKDTKLYEANSRVNGVLDTKPYGDERRRSFLFRTVGYGHGRNFWADLVSTLQIIGYNGTLSIEHEDSLMAADEGLAKAARFLNEIVIREKLKALWWA